MLIRKHDLGVGAVKDKYLNYYLLKALMYDQLANYYKYIDPGKHMLYYQKHFSYMQRFFQPQYRHAYEDNLRVRMAKVRVFHAAVDTPLVDVFINGRKAFQNIRFKQITDYLRFAPGNYTFTVFRSGQTESPLFKKNLTFNPGKTYTLSIGGTISNLDFVLSMDQPYVPVGEARLRFIHLSPDSPPVDIALKNGDVLMSNIGFKHASHYLRLRPMTVDLEIRMTGTKDVILSIPRTKLRQNQATTFALIGLNKGLPRLEMRKFTP